jgi:hypothetical protein
MGELRVGKINALAHDTLLTTNQQGLPSLLLPGGPMMFLSRPSEVGSLVQQLDTAGDGDVASHKVYNPFARRQFSHPSSVQSSLPLKKGARLSFGKQLNTNHDILWADPTLIE